MSPENSPLSYRISEQRGFRIGCNESSNCEERKKMATDNVCSLQWHTLLIITPYLVDLKSKRG
jgi:hypothetical protein